MFYSILEHYLPNLGTAAIKPLGFKVLAPYDYHLYLCHARGQQYVIVETDYLSGLAGIAADAQTAFSVDTLGWLVLNKQQDKAGQTLLPPDTDDGDYDNYTSVVLEAFGMRYAVLAVRITK
jgi:hypothetical protein